MARPAALGAARVAAPARAGGTDPPELPGGARSRTADTWHFRERRCGWKGRGRRRSWAGTRRGGAERSRTEPSRTQPNTAGSHRTGASPAEPSWRQRSRDHARPFGQSRVHPNSDEPSRVCSPRVPVPEGATGGGAGAAAGECRCRCWCWCYPSPGAPQRYRVSGAGGEGSVVPGWLRRTLGRSRVLPGAASGPRLGLAGGPCAPRRAAACAGPRAARRKGLGAGRSPPFPPFPSIASLFPRHCPGAARAAGGTGRSWGCHGVRRSRAALPPGVCDGEVP